MTIRSTAREFRDRDHERGQSMVEFALVITFVFVLFVSTMQMILLMYAYTTLADAAKEGVRYAVVHGTGNTGCEGPGTGPGGVACNHTAGDVKTAVANFAGLSFQNIDSTNEITVDYNPNSANGTGDCNAPGCMVRVSISHTYKPLFGSKWLNVTLNAAASGRVIN